MAASRPRHPFAFAKKGKPIARNDFVRFSAFAWHLHRPLPRIVDLDDIIEDELKKSRDALAASAQRLIEFSADERKLAHFERRSGAVAITLEQDGAPSVPAGKAEQKKTDR